MRKLRILMKSVAVLGFVLFSFLTIFPSSALSDGKVFAVALSKVDLPDQRALIYFDQGTEHLVVETSFLAEGNEFAWVIPLPAVPQVEEASKGLFPTLDLNFQPMLRHRIFAFWYILVASIIFVFLLRLLRLKGFVNILIALFFGGLLGATASLLS